jgi:hypothetical protein
VTCHRADETAGGGLVMPDVLRELARAEIVIADLTGRNANIFYELGIAHATRPAESVLLITQCLTDVPFDVQPYRCIEYTPDADGLRKLRADVARTVKEEFLPTGFVYRLAAGEEGRSKPIISTDRNLHSFMIRDLVPARGSAQVRLDVYRHPPGKRERRVYNKAQSTMVLEEVLPIPETPYVLRLHEAGAIGRSSACAIRIGRGPERGSSPARWGVALAHERADPEPRGRPTTNGTSRSRTEWIAATACPGAGADSGPANMRRRRSIAPAQAFRAPRV